MLGILWCKSQCGPACPVVVCSGAVRYGGFRQGRAIVADSSTGNFGSLCCSLWRADAVRQGATGRGVVWTGGVEQGYDGRRQHGGFRPSLLLSLEGRHGKVWLG